MSGSDPEFVVSAPSRALPNRPCCCRHRTRRRPRPIPTRSRWPGSASDCRRRSRPRSTRWPTGSRSPPTPGCCGPSWTLSANGVPGRRGGRLRLAHRSRPVHRSSGCTDRSGRTASSGRTVRSAPTACSDLIPATSRRSTDTPEATSRAGCNDLHELRARGRSVSPRRQLRVRLDQRRAGSPTGRRRGIAEHVERPRPRGSRDPLRGRSAAHLAAPTIGTVHTGPPAAGGSCRISPTPSARAPPRSRSRPTSPRPRSAADRETSAWSGPASSTARTGSGSVAVGRLLGRGARIHTGSGDVTVAEARCPVTAKSGSGDVLIRSLHQRRPGRELRLGRHLRAVHLRFGRPSLGVRIAHRRRRRRPHGLARPTLGQRADPDRLGGEPGAGSRRAVHQRPGAHRLGGDRGLPGLSRGARWGCGGSSGAIGWALALAGPGSASRAWPSRTDVRWAKSTGRSTIGRSSSRATA